MFPILKRGSTPHGTGGTKYRRIREVCCSRYNKAMFWYAAGQRCRTSSRRSRNTNLWFNECTSRVLEPNFSSVPTHPTNSNYSTISSRKYAEGLSHELYAAICMFGKYVLLSNG